MSAILLRSLAALGVAGCTVAVLAACLPVTRLPCGCHVLMVEALLHRHLLQEGGHHPGLSGGCRWQLYWRPAHVPCLSSARPAEGAYPCTMPPILHCWLGACSVRARAVGRPTQYAVLLLYALDRGVKAGSGLCRPRADGLLGIAA